MMLDTASFEDFSDHVPDKSGERFLKGDFDISGSLIRRWALCMPSPLAKRSYLYLHCLISSIFPKHHYTRRTNVDSYLLAFTFSGKGELQYEGKTYTLEQGEGFLIDCRKAHYYHAISDQGWGYHIIHFDGFAMPDYFAQVEHGNSVKVSFPPDSYFCSLLEQLFETNERLTAGTEMITSCILTNMLTEIMKGIPAYDTGAVPPKMNDICDYIQENFSQDISLAKLAAEFFISKYYLCREFKKYIGQSPIDYLITVRLNNAKVLLHSTKLNISEISSTVGFASLNHFYYCFKKHENTSPSEYRKQWKNESC